MMANATRKKDCLAKVLRKALTPFITLVPFKAKASIPALMKSIISLFIIGTARSRKSINEGITFLQSEEKTTNKRGTMIEIRQTITIIDQLVRLSIKRQV